MVRVGVEIEKEIEYIERECAGRDADLCEMECDMRIASVRWSVDII